MKHQGCCREKVWNYRQRDGRNSGCLGFTIFGKAVSSRFDKVSNEHGLNEDGKYVPPIIAWGVSKCSVELQSQDNFFDRCHGNFVRFNMTL